MLVARIVVVVVVGTGCMFLLPNYLSPNFVRLPSERPLTYLSTMSALTTVCPLFSLNAWSMETTINATEERGKIITPWPVVSVTIRPNSDSDKAKIIAKLCIKIHCYL